MKFKNLDFHKENLLSLAGVYKSKKDKQNLKKPQVLEKYLKENPIITDIYLHLDNDEIGRVASKNLMQILSENYKVIDNPVPMGKDCNDYLCCVLRRNILNKNTQEKVKSDEKIL